MTLRLHWSPDSANLVVRIALECLGLAYEGVRVDRARGANRTPGYLALNPQGLIPVLEDGEIVLFETGAILWHLVERTGRLGPDVPADDPGTRAAVLKWLFYVSNTVHADLRMAFYGDRYIAEEGAGLLARGVAGRLSRHCDLLEDQLGAGGLATSQITLADIYLATCLRWAQIYPAGAPPIATLAPWPRLGALCRRIEALPGARRAFAAEHIVPDRALTAPLPPGLPAGEVTGTG